MSWRDVAPRAAGQPRQSRAINLSLDEIAVQTGCAEHGLTISAIEPLVGGGTRVVMTSSDAAEMARGAFRKWVLSGPVERTPMRLRSR